MNESEIKNVTTNFFDLIRHIKNKFFRPLEQVVKCDISPMQFRTLEVISENKTITMTDLANEVCISKQQLTPMIDKLIDSNAVERKNDKEDRRIIKISPTTYGNELLEERKTKLLNSLSKKLENLSLEDIEKLDIAIDTINKIISELD